jgi:hypothetical protein
MLKTPTHFERNVFINCPFDKPYTPLFNAIVFTVHDIGFRPRCALEASNAGQFRLNKIMDIISSCKYSIHDLSRTERDKVTKLPRFNMPLELGLDLGCRGFGTPFQRGKVSLVLDVELHRYEKFISDIKGQDIYAHGGSVEKVINVVRDWLRNELDPRVVLIPSGKNIYYRYLAFQKALPSLCAKLKWNVKQLPFADFSWVVASWVEENPITNRQVVISKTGRMPKTKSRAVARVNKKGSKK